MNSLAGKYFLPACMVPIGFHIKGHVLCGIMMIVVTFLVAILARIASLYASETPGNTRERKIC